MNNGEIIQLLKDLRWDNYTAPDGQVKECRGCSASYMPGYGTVPKHSKSCKISRAISTLRRGVGSRYRKEAARKTRRG